MGGSTTKAFTAAALGMLIDSGNYTLPPPDGSSRRVPLTWRTPISSIIPSDFVTSDSWATTHLTLEDAASHRTGLSRHDKSSARWYPDENGKLHTATPRDIVRSLRYLPFAEEPRTTYMYCNLMYVVLSHCVETLTGRSLGKVLRKRIWGPLGMGSTFYGLEDLPSDNKLATGYYWDEEGKRFGVVDADLTPEISGAGLVISSVRDYSKWVRCRTYLNPSAAGGSGRADLKQSLKRESRSTRRSTRHCENPRPSREVAAFLTARACMRVAGQRRYIEAARCSLMED
jgi:CubicO group peptidase (beta-lactamase class C family)